MSKAKENLWSHRRYYPGWDWAKDYHEMVVVDSAGRIVLDLRIDHTAEGWGRLREKLFDGAGPDLSVVAAAVETNRGPAVERLLELGCAVYPRNPKAAQRYRDRKAPSGGKTDHRDAFSFSDALRTAVHLWANLSRKKCRWAQIYYRQKRREGKSHACALRCLGQRWLKILWKMGQTRKLYDEQWHTRNQIRHGSWVLAMNITDEITVKSS